ncbi:hypothetical protein DEO72_LG9g473 [Vigna unguiculata]|uniref:Uncharacterized protein n=1 Tax=Vigna unguiculata TaxID=3917 RepID=A0A4D6MVF7_VIGUN|nr:hypothetical protein DEO72_LG9g473 [Vigna unguiculata]
MYDREKKTSPEKRTVKVVLFFSFLRTCTNNITKPHLKKYRRPLLFFSSAPQVVTSPEKRTTEVVLFFSFAPHTHEQHKKTSPEKILQPLSLLFFRSSSGCRSSSATKFGFSVEDYELVRQTTTPSGRFVRHRNYFLLISFAEVVFSSTAFCKPPSLLEHVFDTACLDLISEK